MKQHGDPLVLGAMALFAGFLGLFCIFSPREYRDMMFRFQGSQRWQPDWLVRFEKSEANIWVIRFSGIVPLGIAIFCGYSAYMSSR
jgi:hypothetical protein